MRGSKGRARSVKTGIVGAGIWGTNFALALRDYARADLIVICDLNEARAKLAAQKFGCAWTTDIESLASGDVGAATIATPITFIEIRRSACWRQASM